MKIVFRYLPFAIFLSIAALTEDASTVGKADPQIAAALKQVSAKQIQANIEKLVSFQTRLTISAQDSGAIAAGHGIGAAREWIKGEFERYSRDCGGCLEVKTDSFTESAGPRIPQPTILTNVYAVLKGGDPEAAKRIVLVTGHYDSRNSDVSDVNGFAPGANDDASGTAAAGTRGRVRTNGAHEREVPDLARISQCARERLIQRHVDRAMFLQRELRRAGADTEHAEAFQVSVSAFGGI